TCVVLSLKVRVGVKCCVVPLGIDGFAGVTAIDTSVAGVTVSSVEPVMLPLVAEISDVPALTVVAKPVALIVATLVVADAHTALPSTCVVLSLNVPVAVNCCVVPLAIDGFAGVTAIDRNVAAVTVNWGEPLFPPDVAVIVVVPGATLLTIPELLMVATAALDELHVTVFIRFRVAPSVKIPVAVNC